jgi:glycosyltransferase involved in cell wall biosynthesis
MDRRGVTVVSVFHNRRGRLDESVRSLAGQPDVDEILLVDDGSSDGTGEDLAAHAGGAVCVIRQANMGFTRSLIAAIAQAGGEFIAIHGSGDLSLPGRFAAQAAALRADPGCVAVGCWRRLERPGRQPEIRQDAVGPDQRRQLLTGNPFGHGSVMFRHDAYVRAGGYRACFAYAQDRDLWCRMSGLGRFAVLPEVLYHQWSGEEGSVSGDPRRRVLQRILSESAVWCHRERLAGRPDPVDRAGAEALLLRPRRRALGNELALMALNRLRRGDRAGAAVYAAAAWNESAGPLPALARAGSALLPPGPAP